MIDRDEKGRAPTNPTHSRELRCRGCGVPIYFDNNRVSESTGKKYPLEIGTGARHQCKEYHAVAEQKRRVHKRELEVYAEFLKLRNNNNLISNGHQATTSLRKEEKAQAIDDKAKQKVNTRRVAISIDENSNTQNDDTSIIEHRPSDYRE